METEKQFAEIASIIGDRCRSTMLWHLLDGRALTATELSILADVSAQSASNHLSLLVRSDLLVVERQGRHRYFRFANDEVAHVVESMASLVNATPSAGKKISEPVGIKYARTCYDHLAGKLAVDLADSLRQKGVLRMSDRQLLLTREGRKWFHSRGINIQELENRKRILTRACLDWTERKFHLAGGLGAALLQYMLKEDWIRRKSNTREILVTSVGKREIESQFRISVMP